MGAVGGDDVCAVVIDCGSYSLRAGYAGEDSPRAIFASEVGIRRAKAASSAQRESDDARSPKHTVEAPASAEADAAPQSSNHVALQTSTSDDSRAPPSPAAAAAGGHAAKARSLQQYIGGNLFLASPWLSEDVRGAYTKDASGALVVADWDVMQTLWSAALSEPLGVDSAAAGAAASAPGGTASDGLSRLPLLLVESGGGGWDAAARASAAERAFEGAGAGAVFIAGSAVMTAFAAARSTALVVDVGEHRASAVPVVEGYAMNRTQQHSPLAGATLSEYLRTYVDRLLRERDGSASAEILAPHEVRRRRPENGAVAADGRTIVAERAEPPAGGYTDAHRAFFRRRVLDDIKVSLCAMKGASAARSGGAGGAGGEEGGNAVPGSGAAVNGFDAADGADGSSTSYNTLYELPDGQTIDIGTEVAEAIPESLFNPGMLALSSGSNVFLGLDDATLAASRPLHQLAYDAASSCDIDVRRELYGGVVLAGGGVLFGGVAERFQRELAALTPQMFKLRVAVPPLRYEHTAASWTGASILASCGTFHQMWMSKMEYDEMGATAINRRCP